MPNGLNVILLAGYISIYDFFMFPLVKVRLQMHRYKGLILWDVITRNLHV